MFSQTSSCCSLACSLWLLSCYLCPELDGLLYDPPFRSWKTAMSSILKLLFSRLNKPRSFSLPSRIVCCRPWSPSGGPPLTCLRFVHAAHAGHRSGDAASGGIRSLTWWLVQPGVCLALLAARVHCWLVHFAAHQDPQDLPCRAATLPGAAPACPGPCGPLRFPGLALCRLLKGCSCSLRPSRLSTASHFFFWLSDMLSSGFFLLPRLLVRIGQHQPQ